mmetsp:Transcript_3177/g.4412  ORF Transcript_3177/g.4412 Transcript_3177/m.4412 type:complete len:300 (-) Transcript_3177:182-1081(-)
MSNTTGGLPVNYVTANSPQFPEEVKQQQEKSQQKKSPMKNESSKSDVSTVKKKPIPLSLYSEAQNEKNVASLPALKRHDSQIEEILASASHSTVYLFENGSWIRASIEGPLFVTRRKVQPYLSLIILNRLSPENLNEEIDQYFEVQVIDRYLIFRNTQHTNETIHGLWFHSLEEHQFIANFLHDCIQQSRQQSTGALQPRSNPTTPPRNSSSAGQALLTPELLKPNTLIHRSQGGVSPGVKNQIAADLDPILVKQAVLAILDDPLVMNRFSKKYAELAANRGVGESRNRNSAGAAPTTP